MLFGRKKKEVPPPLPEDEAGRIEYIKGLIKSGQKVKIGDIQRLFNLSYTKAARLIDFANGLNPDKIFAESVVDIEEDENTDSP